MIMSSTVTSVETFVVLSVFSCAASVAAPYSTFDFTLEMVEIFLLRCTNDDEVTALHGVQIAPSGN